MSEPSETECCQLLRKKSRYWLLRKSWDVAKWPVCLICITYNVLLIAMEAVRCGRGWTQVYLRVFLKFINSTQYYFIHQYSFSGIVSQYVQLCFNEQCHWLFNWWRASRLLLWASHIINFWFTPPLRGLLSNYKFLIFRVRNWLRLWESKEVTYLGPSMILNKIDLVSFILHPSFPWSRSSGSSHWTANHQRF